MTWVMTTLPEQRAMPGWKAMLAFRSSWSAPGGGAPPPQQLGEPGDLLALGGLGGVLGQVGLDQEAGLDQIEDHLGVDDAVTGLGHHHPGLGGADEDAGPMTDLDDARHLQALDRLADGRHGHPEAGGQGLHGRQAVTRPQPFSPDQGRDLAGQRPDQSAPRQRRRLAQRQPSPSAPDRAARSDLYIR